MAYQYAGTGGMVVAPGSISFSVNSALIATGIQQAGIGISAMAGSGMKGNQNNTNLKSVGNNNEANKLAKELGFDNAHDFKKTYVPEKDIAKFDMKYNKNTGEIYLENKNGNIQIPTGLYK